MNDKKTNPLVLLALLGAGVWLVTGGKLSLPDIKLPIPGLSQPNNPAVPEPTAALKTLVAPIQAAMKDQDAKAKGVVAGVYQALADVLATDQVSTTGQFRELHQRAGIVASKASGAANLGSVLNQPTSDVLAAAYGVQPGQEIPNEQIPADKRAAMVAACRAIAWGAL